MAIARITSQDATAVGSSSASATYPGATTSGNLLIAHVFDDIDNIPIISGWAQAIFADAATFNIGVYIFYKVATGSESVVSTDVNAGNTARSIAIYEYNGFVGTPTLDMTASNAGTSALTIPTGTTATTTVADELLVAVGGIAKTNTLTSWSNSFTARNTVGTGLKMFTADRIVSATGTYTTTATTTGTAGTNAGAIATFKNVGVTATAAVRFNNRGLRPHPFSPGLAR